MTHWLHLQLYRKQQLVLPALIEFISISWSDLLHVWFYSSVLVIQVYEKKKKIDCAFTSNTEHLFNLKLAANELQRNFKNCDKDERAEKT